MSDRREVVEHLRFYAELGVDGVSRDAAWRQRAQPTNSGEGDAESADSQSLQMDVVPESASEPAESTMAIAPGGESPSPSHRSLDVDPGVALQTLRVHIGDCIRCKLHEQGRTQVVFGVGDPRARLMFVGEGPGHDEDVQGEPFVGRAGQLLTKMIEAIGLKRSEVYIANVVKCRPPGNRNPEPDEIATCEPFLFEQIAIVQPKVVVALGKFAAQTLLRSPAPISRLRGQLYEFRGATLIPTFHPAFLLRSPDYKREAWEDLKKVRALLSEP